MILIYLATRSLFPQRATKNKARWECGGVHSPCCAMERYQHLRSSVAWKMDSSCISLQECARKKAQHPFEILLYVWGNPKWPFTSSPSPKEKRPKDKCMSSSTHGEHLQCYAASLENVFGVLEDLVELPTRGHGRMGCWNPERDDLCLLVIIANSADKGKVPNKALSVKLAQQVRSGAVSRAQMGFKAGSDWSGSFRGHKFKLYLH